jgi:hypothetical protein
VTCPASGAKLTWAWRAASMVWPVSSRAEQSAHRFGPSREVAGTAPGQQGRGEVPQLPGWGSGPADARDHLIEPPAQQVQDESCSAHTTRSPASLEARTEAKI